MIHPRLCPQFPPRPSSSFMSTASFSFLLSYNYSLYSSQSPLQSTLFDFALCHSFSFQNFSFSLFSNSFLSSSSSSTFSLPDALHCGCRQAVYASSSVTGKVRNNELCGSSKDSWPLVNTCRYFWVLLGTRDYLRVPNDKQRYLLVPVDTGWVQVRCMHHHRWQEKCETMNCPGSNFAVFCLSSPTRRCIARKTSAYWSLYSNIFSISMSISSSYSSSSSFRPS